MVDAYNPKKDLVVKPYYNTDCENQLLWTPIVIRRHKNDSKKELNTGQEKTVAFEQKLDEINFTKSLRIETIIYVFVYYLASMNK